MAIRKINHSIEIEIYKRNGCDLHRLGERFKYPEDIGGICPCLLDSISAVIRVLQFGGTLLWKYEDPEYEKVIDGDDLITEFVRCPDPTDAGVVVKITSAIYSSLLICLWLTPSGATPIPHIWFIRLMNTLDGASDRV